VSKDPDPLQAVRRWLFVVLFSAIFLQRFAVPVGPEGIPVSMLITLAVMGVLVLRRQLDIDPIRAALVLLFSAYALICATFNGDRASGSSASLVILMYIPFAFVLRSLDTLFKDCLLAYQKMALICAAGGIAQFFLQFATSSTLLYTFHGYLPPWILLNGFANLLPISYGSPLNRSNGFFMVEPSTFSQFTALAVIIELLFFQVKGRLAIYGAGLLFSYSGTGLIALVLLPAILVSRRSYGTIVVLALFAVAVMLMSSLLHLDVAQQRSGEFESGDSSAHARFIAPVDLLQRYLMPDPQGLLVGIGPGSLRTYTALMPYETHDPAWAKLLFEYGLLGTAMFWTLFILAVFANSPSIWMSLALTIGFLSFGGELLDPRLNALMVVFCIWQKRANFTSARSFRPSAIAANPV